MTGVSFPLHAAFFAALGGDEQLAETIGNRIFDTPPRDAEFPYVTLGDWSAADWSTGTETGTEHRLTVHAWSRAGGKAESWSIVDAIREALHDRDFTLDGQALVNLRFERAAVNLDSDRRTWHGVARFRAVTEPVA